MDEDLPPYLQDPTDWSLDAGTYMCFGMPGQNPSRSEIVWSRSDDAGDFKGAAFSVWAIADEFVSLHPHDDGVRAMLESGREVIIRLPPTARI